MFKKALDAIPSFIITLVKLFLLEFFILEFCRFIFYFHFKTIDGSDIDTLIILKAFYMGLEFDMVACTYALFLPTFLLLLTELFHKKTMFFHKAAFITTLLIF